ncbi:acyl transferase/acyl hydrolase/lysophospholipase [Diplogelasinospora grovesii]|uniref:Lysophospholipase n=1 Tax=Diplogelasinospora grovesii TaxID=303347 RepID=A0AAN6N5H7_9PEZI|nr:acyl transferase/acyl hydrolase/lysophospholipase [Diplogelasinospora grovesii]
MDEHFHNPHDEETDEQIAYQKEILSRNFNFLNSSSSSQPPPPPPLYQPFAATDDGYTSHRSGPDSSGGSFAPPPSEPVPESSNSTSGSGRHGLSGLTSKMKGLMSDIKPAVQGTRSLLSLRTQLDRDLSDPTLFPELSAVAKVRRGLELCAEEQQYISARKLGARDRFAAYMGWDPTQIHPDDVPTIAFGGSGGGYRAMLAFLGYTLAMKKVGLWGCLEYVSGVSGSCWAIAAYYTFGNGSVEAVIEHCKKRLSPHHPLSPDAIQQVLSNKPHGEYQTLGPLIQKAKSGLHTVPMDLYAVFTTGYLFLQPDPLLQPGGSAETEIPGYHRRPGWWKWTDAKKHLLNGSEPLPILTAIRHERPWKDWADPEHPFSNEDASTSEHSNARDAWFQWFEMTPYEVGCDELEAWVPTWGFGRKFEEGVSVTPLPEQSLALLLGLCTSAPAGPLSSYLATIQRNLPAGFIGSAINNVASGVAKMWGKHETAVFENHHPLHASNGAYSLTSSFLFPPLFPALLFGVANELEHNFLYHYTPTPKGTPRPPGIENSPKIHLIDSGMDNNCPTYVMLHPERQVDVILNMDASSDVQKDTFQQRVSQIGYRRSLDFRKRRPDLKPDGDPKNPDRFKGLYAQIYDGQLVMQTRPTTVEDSYGKTVTNPPAAPARQDCTMVYLPLLPNEKAVPGYDPSTAKFSGSYNLVWTPEQVDMIIRTSMANFMEGQDTIKEALFNAWQRRRWMREQREQQQQAVAGAAVVGAGAGAGTGPGAVSAGAVQNQ